ncbi:MAG: hypothetical protein F6K56_11105 [Moorea sp. SIO3G5]|nr:hypothetical protein [Moorena sp. SIO3G5]
MQKRPMPKNKQERRAKPHHSKKIDSIKRRNEIEYKDEVKKKVKYNHQIDGKKTEIQKVQLSQKEKNNEPERNQQQREHHREEKQPQNRLLQQGMIKDKSWKTGGKNEAIRLKQKGLRDPSSGKTTGVRLSKRGREETKRFTPEVNTMGAAIRARTEINAHLPDPSNIITTKQINKDEELINARKEVKKKEIMDAENKLSREESKRKGLEDEIKQYQGTKESKKKLNERKQETEQRISKLRKEINYLNNNKPLEKYEVNERIVEEAKKRTVEKAEKDLAKKGHQIANMFGGGGDFENVVSTTYWQEKKQTMIEEAINEIMNDKGEKWQRDKILIKHTVYAMKTREDQKEKRLAAAKNIRYKMYYRQTDKISHCILDEVIPDNVYTGMSGDEADKELAEYKISLKDKIKEYVEANEETRSRLYKDIEMSETLINSLGTVEEQTMKRTQEREVRNDGENQ